MGHVMQKMRRQAQKRYVDIGTYALLDRLNLHLCVCLDFQRVCRLHCIPSYFFSLHLILSLSPAPPPSLLLPFVSACPMNQSGWQCVAVRELVKVISHVEPGQDLDGPSWRQERRDSGRFLQSNSCVLSSFFFVCVALQRFTVERWDGEEGMKGRNEWEKKANTGPRPVLNSTPFIQMSQYDGLTSVPLFFPRKAHKFVGYWVCECLCTCACDCSLRVCVSWLLLG